MFTGIIEELGRIGLFEKYGGGARVRIDSEVVIKGTMEGDSIAVNGVCLTAFNVSLGSFVADISGETLNRSAIGNLKVGSSVNLERAVTPTTRLGGHIVQGHVDGRGKLVRTIQESDFWTVRVSYPGELGKYLVYKGSVSVDGISLTVANLTDEYFEVAIIPKTWELTNLSNLKNGDAVNLETDIIAKYIERIMFYRNLEIKKDGARSIS